MSIDTLMLLIFWVTVATITFPILAVVSEIIGVFLTKNLTSLEQKELIQHRAKLATVSFSLAAALSGIFVFYLSRNLNALETVQKTEQAKIAKVKEQEYQQKLDATKLDAKAARQQAETAKQEIEIARQQAENARQQAEIILDRHQPRKLTPEQQEKLIQILKSSEKGMVYLQVPMDDREAMTFAENLDTLFKSSGWKTDGIGVGGYGSDTVGLYVEAYNKVETLPPFADNFVKALKSAGLPVQEKITITKEPNANNGISLLIGHKSKY